MQSNETDTEGNLVIHYDDTLEDFFELTRLYQNLKGQLKDQVRRVLNVVSLHLRSEWTTFEIFQPDTDDYQDGKLVWLLLNVQFERPNLVQFDEFDLSEGFPVKWLYLTEDGIVRELDELHRKMGIIDLINKEKVDECIKAKQEYDARLQLIDKLFKEKIDVSGV